MSGTVLTTAQEVTALQANMTALHGAVTDIQGRLDAALNNPAGTGDPAVAAELHTINTDLEGVIAALAPHAATGVVFNSADPTPNSPGGRNTPGADPANPMAGFDPSQPVTA